jgi:cytosine permease
MASNLPNYLAAARPVPQANRAPWYKNVAQTYAGVMLWYVFWMGLAKPGGFGGTLAEGIWPPLVGILAGGLICHFFFYLVPGLLGMKTGLPLYVVGTSTYGAQGGLFMPGLLMGLLQFGWLGVNACMVAKVLCDCFQEAGTVVVPNPLHAGIAVVFAVAAAFMGLKGIQYVARVASFFPIIPIVVLLVLFVCTVGGLGKFKGADAVQAGRNAYNRAMVGPRKAIVDAAKAAKPDNDTMNAGKAAAKADKDAPKTAEKGPASPAAPMSSYAIILLVVGVVVGFFATAGAAGTDIAMSSRNAKDVQLGGLTGITLATLFAGGLAILIVAGAYGTPDKLPATELGNYLDPLALMQGILGKATANVFLILLAISAFPGACFSAFIAANSFKTTMPKVNPFLSVGIGTVVSIFLAVTGWAMQVIPFFGIIGASFGPVCGAMVADYLLSHGKWAGPRAGFNPAGWISWAAGFVVGALNPVCDLLQREPPVQIPCAPVAAFVVGLVLYFVLAKAGLQSKTLDMPQAAA